MSRSRIIHPEPLDDNTPITPFLDEETEEDDD